MVVIVNSHWSCGSTKTAEDTDKTAKETLHLISLAQSLFAQIPSLLYVEKNKQNKTHFFLFFLINITISYCKQPDNPSNRVNTEKENALSMTMTKMGKKDFLVYIFNIFFNDVSQCFSRTSFQGVRSLQNQLSEIITKCFCG